MAATEEFKVDGKDLKEKVKQLIHEGNVNRIIVKNGSGKSLIEIPVNVGVVGAVIAPVLAAVGALALMVTECTVVVTRAEKKKG